MSVTFSAPLSGTVVALADVPDPVFAGEIVGPGIAIQPDAEADVTVTAPVSGKIIKIHPHAFVILAEDGTGALVHLGLDTVALAGEGFTLHQENKAVVSDGDQMITWNPKEIEAGGRNPIVPVIALEAKAQNLELLVEPGAQVEAGAPLLRVN
ncbi:PTS glucose transporter subunit IIA [Boudabousia liubingyangii]|uniref:PTS glucose transporter subunit IIA n=1 Tax=Boudabousia liubingyangii TaxID=1921764 RepID=A0A1Q5PMP5_9ACTO|nr:PTS glucose transporter subunit IIA [Boudabousia liubingyangii]OKL47426.1 PTS glucose transporter subunit IIA [Boudabousia liubingyangii]OKL48797.1 PTS glucose transporter subunit IIA [Boudabousia liubingyangii]